MRLSYEVGPVRPPFNFAFIAIFLAMGLSGCSGGAGSSIEEEQTPNFDAGAYFLPYFDSDGRLFLVDPLQPVTPTQVDTVERPFDVFSMRPVPGYLNSGIRISRDLRLDSLLHLKEGKIFQVEMNKDAPAPVRQVSALEDVCKIDGMMLFAGGEAILSLETAGPDQICLSFPNDNETALIRSTDQPSDPPLIPMGRVHVTDVIQDQNLRPSRILMTEVTDDDVILLRTADLNLTNRQTIFAISQISVGVQKAGTQLYYMRVRFPGEQAEKLVEINLDDRSHRVLLSLSTEGSPDLFRASTYDGEGIYFTAVDKIYSYQYGEAMAQEVGTTTSKQVDWLRVTDDRIIVRDSVSSPDARTLIWSLPKRIGSGPPQLLAVEGEANEIEPIYASGRRIFYTHRSTSSAIAISDLGTDPIAYPNAIWPGIDVAVPFMENAGQLAWVPFLESHHQQAGADRITLDVVSPETGLVLQHLGEVIVPGPHTARFNGTVFGRYGLLNIVKTDQNGFVADLDVYFVDMLTSNSLTPVATSAAWEGLPFYIGPVF